MTCGVIFKEDGINENLIQLIEDDISSRAKEFIKRGTFTRYNQELLALSIIKETRMKYNLEGWNKYLEKITGYSQKEIAEIQEKKP